MTYGATLRAELNRRHPEADQRAGYLTNAPWWRRRYFIRWPNGKLTRGFTPRGTARMAKRYERWSA